MTSDNEGNRTKRTRISDGTYDLYTGDHRQRLTSVTTYNAIQIKVLEVRYEYDALDRRIRRNVDANSDNVFEVQQRFLYDTSLFPLLGGEGQGEGAFHEVVQIVDEVTGHRQHRFLNGPAPDMVLADEVFSSTGTPGDILWLLQDQQQTVTDVATMSSTSGPATLRNHLEYNAFGRITSQTNSAYQPQQTYTGQMLDSATGLLYYDARWFDPHTNQFLSEDPIGFRAGDANLRRYVGNSNPNATDPSGMLPNKNNAISLEQLIRLIRITEESHPEMTPREMLDLALRFHKSGPDLWVYIYTHEQGWIDVPHFLEAATWTCDGYSVPVVVTGGFFVEIRQLYSWSIDAQSSAFGAEDMTSNLQGALFGATFNQNVPLSQQLEKFFLQLGPRKPRDWQYFPFLPKTQLHFEQMWIEDRRQANMVSTLVRCHNVQFAELPYDDPPIPNRSSEPNSP